MSTVPAVTTGGWLPSVGEVLTAARDTSMLLRLRWRFVRGVRSRALIGLGFGLFAVLILIASQIGTLVRKAAEQGTGTSAGQFSVNYVIALGRGELGAIGATAIGSVFIVALFTPFTGSSMTSLAPSDDLAGLRPARLHRYFDSVVTGVASAIGFFQLITLTALGSLLTLDGGRAGGLLFVWAVWPAVVMLTASEGWLIELVHRRLGARVRAALGLTLASVLGLAVYFDPKHGTTLFGVGVQVIDTVRAAAAGDVSRVLVGLGVVAAVTVVLFVVGLLACRAALALPAPVAATRENRRRLIPMSSRPNVALTQIVIAQVWRTSEVRRPLKTILFLGVPAVWFIGGDNVMTTLVVAVPLSVALAFGTNVFGVLGHGLPWLASQPRLMRKLFIVVCSVQVAMTLLLAFLLWAPATLFGRVDPGDVAAVAAGTVAATFLTSRSAASKSVHRPFLARLGGRGDMVVPPLTAINYTLRFAFFSGQIGVIVMSRDGWIQVGMVALVVVWSLLRFTWLARQWNSRDVQAFVTKQVSAA